MTESAGTAPSGLLRVQGSSKLAFGATTAALVTLASGGTAVLVSSATDTVATPTSLPPLSLPPSAVAPDAPVVVDHAAGSSPTPAPDPTEQALRDALAERRQPGRRTITAPLVPVAQPSPVPTQAPVAEPPVVVEPPAVVPPAPGKGNHNGNGVDKPTTPTTQKPPAARPTPPAADPAGGKGHAYGHGKPKHDSADPDRPRKGKHAREHGKGKGRHSR